MCIKPQEISQERLRAIAAGIHILFKHAHRDKWQMSWLLLGNKLGSKGRNPVCCRVEETRTFVLSFLFFAPFCPLLSNKLDNSATNSIVAELRTSQRRGNISKKDKCGCRHMVVAQWFRHTRTSEHAQKGYHKTSPLRVCCSSVRSYHERNQTPEKSSSTKPRPHQDTKPSQPPCRIPQWGRTNEQLWQPEPTEHFRWGPEADCMVQLCK